MNLNEHLWDQLGPVVCYRVTSTTTQTFYKCWSKNGLPSDQAGEQQKKEIPEGFFQCTVLAQAAEGTVC